jgi:hypothetical protein
LNRSDILDEAKQKTYKDEKMEITIKELLSNKPTPKRYGTKIVNGRMVRYEIKEKGE